MNKEIKAPELDRHERVSRSFELADMRATEENGVIEGHAAVFNQRTNIGGWFYEVMERGAFDGTNFDDVLLSVNHDLRKIPLARSRRNNGNSTMQLSVDDKGLLVKANLDIERNAEAKSLHSSVDRGDITGMSFIFYVKQERWIDLDTNMPTRYIEKVDRVIEVSAVNFPAYEGTDIDARDKDALDNAKKALDNARSQNGLDNPGANDIEVLKYRAYLKAK